MEYPIDRYRQRAWKTFSDLFETFKSSTNAWQVGNVFDTLTDYVVRFPEAEPSPCAVAEAALERWHRTQGSMCWYDDYGWWGIASAKAFDDEYAGIFGSHRGDFQKIATDCWDVMRRGKPDKEYEGKGYRGVPMVWGNRDEGSQTGYFTSPETWAVPRFPGGVWQYEMFVDARGEGECSPSNPSNPSMSDKMGWGDFAPPQVVKLGPFQNTVVNGLYLVLALRLRLRDEGAGADKALRSEMMFLNSWFELEKDEGLLLHFPDGSALVRERVGTYDYCEATKSYPPVRGYQVDKVWCGDQGLILGGLLDYLSVEPSDPKAESRAVSIARGVLRHLVLDQGVMPYSAGFDAYNDADDYSCGSGVFWRYLLWGFGRNAALRKEVLSFVAEDPENNAIYKSAEHAYASKPPYEPTNNKLFTDFNVLATLTAAIEILKEAERSGAEE